MKPRSLASRLFDRSAPAPGGSPRAAGAAKYERQVDCREEEARGERCHREIHFAFLPEKYEPLVEVEEAQVKAKEERKKKRKEKYNKVKKNFGKALRCSWKCVILGLYNFALGYSTPITAAATFIPDFHPSRARC
ncbi:required for drug-induced death protein 1-like [Lampris incognitus]|uniref:required for drug-induced death protein 1-like n=1 Tax=Lampris incognitus TaxID=2546036 RepID=UPI0024B6253C|nr:required for drug-induced death protein 1-like [Lampris incognitus]